MLRPANPVISRCETGKQKKLLFYFSYIFLPGGLLFIFSHFFYKNVCSRLIVLNESPNSVCSNAVFVSFFRDFVFFQDLGITQYLWVSQVFAQQGSMSHQVAILEPHLLASTAASELFAIPTIPAFMQVNIAPSASEVLVEIILYNPLIQMRREAAFQKNAGGLH